MIYYAIIGDIKSSKVLNDRFNIQEKLKRTLININLTYKNDIAANFLITLGDEFQGLLLNAGNILQIVKFIQREMYPVKIRFGIGIGDVLTEINKEAAIGADGPAFYAARNMLLEMHELENKIKIQAPDIQLAEYKDKQNFEIIEINTMLSLVKTIEDGWSDKQRYTIWDMMINKGSQEACALRMETSQSTVARRLADGKYVVYVNALNVIEEAIVKFGEV